MSLMLRQACQPMLDDADLEIMHVGISSDKSLSIVGGCGKPLLNLQGIRFGSFKPTTKEITYAVELFTLFLNKEADKLVKYVAAKQASTVDEPLPLPEHCVAYGTYVNYRGDNNCNISVYQDGTITVSNKQSIADLVAFMDSDVIDNVMEYFDKAQVQATEREKLRIMQTSLNKCDI